jgi:hypothetical protein
LDPASTLTVLAKYFTWIVVAIVVGTTIVGGIAFGRTETGAAKTFSLLLQRASALQMLAVILIILTAATLRILNLIGSDSIVSILSGIARYVLGGTSRTKQGDEEKTTP